MELRDRASGKRVFQLAVVFAFLIWSILPYSRVPILSISSVPFFFLLLLATSHQIYLQRKRAGRAPDSFWLYMAAHRVLVQDLVLGAVLGTASLLIEAIRSVFIAVGVLPAISVIDSIWFIIALYFFLKRPGLRRILGRSVPAGKPESEVLEELCKKYGIRQPELRIFPPGKRQVPNAFSWSLPGKNGYIFANEELYEVLEKEEVAGIFSHELGHIIRKHSEKSFLLSSLVPLAWLDALILSFGYVKWPFYIFAAIVIMVFGVIYMLRIRGTVNRKFEKSADIFAGRNFDRETYINALRKLSQYTPYRKESRKRFDSHDSLERREELIRSL